MAQTVVLKVGMSCQGCAGAVRRVLGKMEGVESYDIDMKEQKVTVTGNVQPEAVLQTVSKTGKKTAFWEAEAPVQPEIKPAEPESKPAAETAAPAEHEIKPAAETAAPVEPENKPSEAAASVRNEDKPSETAASADHENKSSETVAVA
ncbi:copper transport protein CCH-like [Prosopis cineraria]|uniref:copper transport protein CCH-like n=1 Tax=Prosopis cineraria TaxID=364024 RepID=UPI00240F347D|nr:copper transport protein CCH-like [Prosopis cineraria]